MQIVRILMVLIVMSSLGMSKDYYRCYEYSPSNFKLNPQVSYDRMILSVPKVWPKQETNSLILLFLDKDGREMKMSQYVNCKYGKSIYGESIDGYICGGECDAGQLFMKKDMSLSFPKEYKLSVDIEGGMNAVQERADLDLKKGIALANSHSVKCPPYVEKLFNPTRDGEHGGDPLLNVCYKKKSRKEGKIQYQGCFMSPKKCNSIGKEHFGHYQSIEDSYRAFLRCIDSGPQK